MIVVAAITVCTDAAGTLATYYYCDGVGWATGASDTPAHTYIEPRLRRGGGYSRSIFSGTAIFGAMQVSAGTVSLMNGDGALDAWRGYGFDSRPISIYVGEEGAAFPSAFTLVCKTTMRSARVGMQSVEIALRDPMLALDKPVVRNVFLGTGGLEGPGSLANQPRPRALGSTWFTPVVPVDISNNIFFVCEEASYSSGNAVYDGGVGLTLGANYADTATLLSTPPGAGQARLYVGGPTYVRTGSTPTQKISVSRLPAIGNGVVMSTLAVEAGLTTHASFLSGPVMGSYVPDAKTTYLEIFTRESLQSPQWFGIDRDGKFVIKDVADPSGGSPVSTIRQHDMRSIVRDVPDGAEIPIWRVIARGDRNWSFGETLQASAGQTPRVEFFAADIDSDSAVLTKHPYAGELAIEIGNDPSGSAAAHLALHKVDRDVFAVELQHLAEWSAIDLGDVVTVQHPRMGLSAGRKLMVAGIGLDFRSRSIALTLWG